MAATVADRGGFDVIVVGAGIMGSCAAYVASARHVRVLLLERLDLLHCRSLSLDESRGVRATDAQAHYSPLVRLAARLWDDPQRDARDVAASSSSRDAASPATAEAFARAFKRASQPISAIDGSTRPFNVKTSRGHANEYP
uniref:FAD dependent oxidoreductase domain-containing protein n=1 Tax=Oryza brachyantha TaxID=4533 RepID=J3KZ23_ORYBR